MDKEMLVCDIELFQHSYLPFIPADGDVNACVELLKESQLLVQKRNSLQWTEFQNTPSGIQESEKKVFLGIANIAKELASHTLQYPVQGHSVSEARVEYLNCPDNHIASEIPGANFRNGGCFVLNDTSRLFSESNILASPNIAVVAEYKKELENELDNHLKVVSAANHIMNDDPRRAFMFGITIEDAMVSLWYFSRSHSTKSKPFDFMKNPKLLISIFLSFLFGHETGLGYDPAIRRCPRDPVYYEYEVGSRYYRTRGSLSSYRSLGITDRMTRVWKAVEISGFDGTPLSGKEVALKDVWLDHDARTEKEIQNAVFEAINKEKELNKAGRESRLDVFSDWPSILKRIKLDLENDKFRRYFMEIDCDHRGQLTKQIPTGAVATTGLITKQEEPQSRSFRLKDADPSRALDSIVRPSSSTSARLAQANASARATPTPATTPPSAANATTLNAESRAREYKPKRRYFLVFLDVGQALHDVSTLPVLLDALRDIIFALLFLFIGNWVHRDISTGNIIVMVNGEAVHGKLSDLEYAKEFSSTTTNSPDTKTGTPFFMAFELLANSPLNQWCKFSVGTKKKVYKFLDFFTADEDPPLPNSRGANISNTLTRPNTVIYTFQYDLESVLWIILWTLLARVAYLPGQIYVHDIYVNRLENTQERYHIVFFQDHLRTTLLDKLHDGLSDFVPIIANFGSNFWGAYVTREDKHQVRDPSSYVKIYAVMMDFLGNCMVLAKKQGIPPLISLDPGQVTESTKPTTTDGAGASKRPHSDGDIDSDNKKPRLAERRLDHEHLFT